MSRNSTGENAIFTPANMVTIVRILLVPVFVVAILSPWPDFFPYWTEADLWKPWIAAFIFAALSCTDAVDGYLARSRGEVTIFGKFVDPLADKILVAAALLALVELQLLPSWVALIILGREFIVSGLRMLVATHGVAIAASWYGKAKTVFQIIAIILFIVKGSPILTSLHEQAGLALYIISWIFMIIAVLLTIVSMCDYFLKCIPVFKMKPQEAAPTDSSEERLEIYNANRDLAKQVIEAGKKKKLHLSTAESCTGGLIGAALTSIPGSSEVFEGGIISYLNDIKEQVLHVDEDDLRDHGAVSSEVAEEMAVGSRTVCQADIAVSVTGIAGPDGGVEGKPVGTVWFGIASDSYTHTFVRHFEGDRDVVRARTVQFALELYLCALSDSLEFPIQDDQVK